MIHANGLIFTIAAGLGLAFIGGFVATKLRLPPIAGYLLAGVLLGPFTPGFVANESIASELAGVGIILLMFGVGIHFSLRDLLAVKSIAVPGAIGQILVATVLGVGVSTLWGWGPGPGVLLGLSISVASTVVLLRALGERQELNTPEGRVAIGWLIVEDLFTVLVLVLLPAISPGLGGNGTPDDQPWIAIGLEIVKIVVLSAVMLIAGARFIPWLLVQVTRMGSRELFTLAVLAVALGIAVISAAVFGASLALGAFLAGVVISESDLSHQAAADALPMRDAFAVLFFVSVGMLFNPLFLIQEPLKILAILGLVVVGKGLTKLILASALGHPLRTGLTVAAGLAQVGEFSFILAEQGHTLGILPDEGRNLILAAAILSIIINPVVIGAIEPVERWVKARPRLAAVLERGDQFSLPPLAETESRPRAHAVLCGYGRVGRLIANVLERRGFTYVVIERDYRLVKELRERGIEALCGDAANPIMLELTHLDRARVLIAAIDDVAGTRYLVEQARRMNPRITIVARAHGDMEWAHLRQLGVDDVVLADRELAAEMARFTLHRFGVGGAELNAIIQGLRQKGGTDD